MKTTTAATAYSVVLLLICAIRSVSAEEIHPCSITEPEIAQPPDDPNASPFPRGNWFINENRTIWAGWDAAHLKVGGNKVLWIRPAGTDLKVVAERLDGEGEFEASTPCCYPTGFQATGLHFSHAGCWRISAASGQDELSFISFVKARPNKVLHGPPVDSPHVFCHASCTAMMLASQEARQSPGARKLER